MGEELSREEIKERIFKLLNESPFYRHLGMEVVEAGEGRARLRLPVKDELKNLYGILHGGVIAALLDSSCSIAVGTLLEPDEAAVTLDQRINYISNVKEGVLYGEGRALHKGRFTGVGQAEVRDEEGNLVAAGMTTTFVIRRGVNQVRDARDPVDERLKQG
ncbi:MAG: PaaI family thioesterase [Actinobacteria bacterium]|nr:PaaI family thioesterase [Actinomycetota bacterium]MDI6831636.1 PaaI family thioesterase [Actinomycetota bacterium]